MDGSRMRSFGYMRRLGLRVFGDVDLSILTIVVMNVIPLNEASREIVSTRVYAVASLCKCAKILWF